MAGKKGNKKKKKKKKKVRISVEPKEPTEKTVFKMKVAELEKKLDDASNNLKKEEVSLEQLKSKHTEEVESKVACVEYLKHVLEEASGDMTDIQRKLQWIRDLTELTELRASELQRNLHSSKEHKESIFNEQKTELEEKLSRLEELREKKNSQLTHLKRLGEDLERKTSAERIKKRQSKRAYVNRLLKKREDFEDLVDSVCSDAEEVFELGLPAGAKSQLEENIRLRGECQKASENLLNVQDQRRHLKDVENILDLEMDTQKSAETRIHDLQERLEVRQNHLLEERDQLQSPHAIGKEELGIIQSKIRGNQRKITKTIDKISNLGEILRDQNLYIKSLENQLKIKTDRNGLRMSKILRAGQTLKTKVREVKDEKNCMDLDLLKQMRMLLEDD